MTDERGRGMIYGVAFGCFAVGIFAGALLHWAWVGVSAEIDAEQDLY